MKKGEVRPRCEECAVAVRVEECAVAVRVVANRMAVTGRKEPAVAGKEVAAAAAVGASCLRTLSFVRLETELHYSTYSVSYLRKNG